MTYLFFGDIGHEPPLEPPDPDAPPRCPICGSDEGDRLYINRRDGTVFGCNAPHCVDSVDIYDYFSDTLYI